MDKRRITLIGGLVLGAIAVIFIYLQDQRRQGEIERLRRERENRKVVVAKTNISKGQLLTANVLGYTPVPVRKLEPGSTEYAEAVLGKIALTSFIKGQQITLSKITDMQQTLSYKLAPGKRAVTISVDRISSVNGMVAPGDFVDIVGTFPYPFPSAGKKDAPSVVTLFQQVRVLAVDTVTSKEEMAVQKKTESELAAAAFTFTSITFALSEEEAKLLLFALDIGKIKLLLRSAADESKGPKEVLTMDKAWEKIFSIKKAEAMAPKKVEVFRGLERKVEDLGE